MYGGFVSILRFCNTQLLSLIVFHIEQDLHSLAKKDNTSVRV
jgi:hypothetical protein